MCLLILADCILVGLEQIGCHLRLVSFGDVIVLGVVLLEDHTHLDDRNVALKMVNDLLGNLIFGLCPVLGDGLTGHFLRILVLLHVRAGGTVQAHGFAIRKADENTGGVGELVVSVRVDGLDDEGRDVLTVHMVLTKRDLRLEVFVHRTIYMNKLTALSGIQTHCCSYQQSCQYRKYLFHCCLYFDFKFTIDGPYAVPGFTELLDQPFVSAYIDGVEGDEGSAFGDVWRKAFDPLFIALAKDLVIREGDRRDVVRSFYLEGYIGEILDSLLLCYTESHLIGKLINRAFGVIPFAIHTANRKAKL